MLIINISVVEIFVVDYINRLTIVYIVADYTLIKNIIVVDTQIVKLIVSSRGFDSMSNRREKMKSKIVSN